MKSCLEKNDIKMCLTHNEGRSVVAIKTLKGRLSKYMTSVY